MTVEEFENKCMDIIEQIVSIDAKQDRQGAIKISEKMLEKAKEKGNKKIIDIYDRVLKEFKLAGQYLLMATKKGIIKKTNFWRHW